MTFVRMPGRQRGQGDAEEDGTHIEVDNEWTRVCVALGRVSGVRVSQSTNVTSVARTVYRLVKVALG